MAQSQIDVIVIGSGFGGAPLAARLAEAGVRVTLLERGPWRDTLPVRSMGIERTSGFPRGMGLITRLLRNVGGNRPWPWRMIGSRTGLFELFFGDGVTLAVSSNVGGGSHVYSAIHSRPGIENYWDGHAEGVSSQDMERYYQSVLDRFASVVPTPEHRMPNTTAQRFGQDESLEPAVPYPGARIGYLLPGDPDVPHVVDGPHGIQRREVDYAANDDGFLGSPGGGKTTLDVIYLWPGMQTGNLELRDMAEVRQISRGRAGHGPRYEVAYRDLRGGGSHVLRADHVVVAAGTLNTLKLLMTSRHAGGLTGMPRLGLNFGTNGDFVGFWDRCSADDLTPGLPTRGGFRLRGAEGSPIFGGGAFPSSADYPLPGRLKRRIGRSQLVFGMGVDAMDGRASYDGVRFRLSFDTAGSPIFAEIWNAADIISVRTGARLRYRRNAMTVHPMGGAGLGRDETSGVVGGDGTVFGHPGLYVTDAAVFPTSPGAPPSLSIAAWSEYVAAGILEREGCR